MAKLGRICEALTTPFTILCTLIYAHSTASVWQYAVCRMQSVACINPPINQRDFKVAKHLSATRSAYIYISTRTQPVERQFKVNQDICQFVFAIRSVVKPGRDLREVGLNRCSCHSSFIRGCSVK